MSRSGFLADSHKKRVMLIGRMLGGPFWETLSGRPGPWSPCLSARRI